ncbi:GDP/UDP-N,N'-diacetylbacillosamine 2-epimerase (hydrolyzing) [Paraburkholderia kirstenboschensis]|uniref:UDP-N-acetylglucosamine 2-epimerase n=1 Tax=Paraburkholderia kirstenboschensis TaxID=1245436 RepID=UPI000AD1C137|nr:UDP-N-acetylglucosamine 2-epimerase [Paraburkholderia kirstenboschensis]CAD6540485.1 GDP/UDP-N,N'-diacetylbacillosamine 2-epimerase (hydrolyzing) [Paraburkholderia kirstenboschensis]
MNRTICFFTGTRAEYGLLRPLMKAIASTPGATLKTLVTGSHLAESAGATWREIAADGLPIDERVEVLLDSGTDEGVAASIGLGVMRYAEALKRLAPDMLVILGDRFEAIAAAIAATVCKTPIVHIHGGELTLGAMDDAFRHAITKMSHLHFTSTEAYRHRVIQLGEDPARVHNVGALGVENARTLPLLERSEVERRLNLTAGQPYFLVTFHPATLDRQVPDEQLRALLDALETFPDRAIVFTGANADAGGAGLNRLLAEYAQKHADRYRFSMSLGATLYLSAARAADVVIGNSSSGIIEVPSFGTPTVDIGIRQQGRIRSESVLTCAAEIEAIKGAISKALTPAFRARAATAANPYEQSATTARMVETLMTWDNATALHKNFHDTLPNSLARAPSDGVAT